MAAPGNGNVTCPAPFLLSSNFPPRGGEIRARFCLPVTRNESCCLPCPMTDWVFSDNFQRLEPTANYVGIASLICNVLLLLTYLVLPEEKSHRHYLSIGLTVSLILLSIAFVIPLGTQPDMCFDTFTPDNMHSDTGCAWTGALLLAGAMGAIVWILLRSIWTALRIIFDFRRTDIFQWVSIALGVGIPGLFLAIEMGTIGVSYKLGNVCLPSGPEAFVAWYVWLVVFAGLSAIILIATIVFCLWKFAISALAGVGVSTHKSTASANSAALSEPEPGQPPSKRAMKRQKRVEWARIKKVLRLQWRTIVLAFIILNESVFFGLVFTQSTGAAEAAVHGQTLPDRIWAACLIVNDGDKSACLAQSSGLGLSGPRVIATWLLLSTLGLVVFLLMLRWSMFVGWYEILKNPRAFIANFKGRRSSLASDDQEFVVQKEPKHLSLTKPLGSETNAAHHNADLRAEARTGNVSPVSEVDEIDAKEAREDRIVV